MEKFIRKPSVALYSGVRVDRDTKLEYKTENVEQTVENLVLHSLTRVAGEGYESVYNTTVQLNEGDILIYEEDGRGYIKPVDAFVSVDEAIETLTDVKGVVEDDVCSE